MDNSLTVEGTIVKASKLWWIKINTKAFRTSPVDGATFPYFIRIKYTINNTDYEKGKFVYWGKESITVGDIVIVTYNENNPSKILKVEKKDQ